MGKRRPVPSSSESEESDSVANRKKVGKKEKHGKEKSKEVKERKRAKEKDKKDKSHKHHKKDDARSSGKKADKNEGKAKEHREDGKPQLLSSDAQKSPGVEKTKTSKDKKRKKEEADPPMKEVVFSGAEAFRSSAKPFGMELDGALVVDLADKGSLAVSAGVQIGWRVRSVGGREVPEEAEGAAARILREAEERMAMQSGGEVCVCFITAEPEHWTRALKKLAR